MRVAIYARFSCDKQSEASTEDQIRLCRARANHLVAEVVCVHADDGISGSIPVGDRPGGRALLADFLGDRFDTLIVEGLDRLSRDLVESERIVRRLEHRGVRIIGCADGYDSELAGRKVMRQVRSLVNELYLDDLRHKTHRGLAGRVDRGFHGGGKSFGYRSVPIDGGHKLQVDAEQARWVTWIFEQYAHGWSVQAIAY